MKDVEVKAPKVITVRLDDRYVTLKVDIKKQEDNHSLVIQMLPLFQ